MEKLTFDKFDLFIKYSIRTMKDLQCKPALNKYQRLMTLAEKVWLKYVYNGKIKFGSITHTYLLKQIIY